MPLACQAAKEGLGEEILVRRLPRPSMQVYDCQAAAGHTGGRLPQVSQQGSIVGASQPDDHIAQAGHGRRDRLHQAITTWRQALHQPCRDALLPVGAKSPGKIATLCSCARAV